MKRSTWWSLGLAGAAAAGLLAWAFTPRAVEVEAASVTRGPFETAVEEDGRTRVSERHVVAAPLAGRLRRIALREGDAVAVGQVLALIEPQVAPLLDERSRREQQARAEGLRAAVERARTRVQAAQVGVDQALNEQRRTAQLVAQGFVSPAKAETDRLAVDAARREREAAVDSEHMARHDLEQVEAILQARPLPMPDTGPGSGAAPETSRETAREATRGTSREATRKANRETTREPNRGVPAGRAGDYAVRSPVAGTVLRVMQVSEGVVGVGTPLLELADTGRLEIVAELLTTDAAGALPGSPVRIERWGGPQALQGQVRRVEPAAFTKVSALGVEEQRVNVLIDLAPGPLATPRAVASASSPVTPSAASLGDGWRVAVHIITRREADVLRVPVSAVFPWPGTASAATPASAPADPQASAGERMGIFVVEGARAHLRAVQVGARNGSQAWIRSGLSPGDTVIAYPPPSVSDGVRVQARRG